MMKTKKDSMDVFFDGEDYEMSADTSVVHMSDIIRRVVLVVSVIILAVSLVIIALNIGGESKADEVEPDRLLDSVVINPPPELPSGGYNLEHLINRRGELQPQWLERFEENNDLVGWLRIGDTIVDYPVVHSGCNEHYLKHNFNGRRHFDGTLFLDGSTPMINTRRPDNSVIYGHNLNNGRKFAYLMGYFTTPNGKRNLDTAYNKNPTLEFINIFCDEGRDTYKIFAAMFINSSWNDGHVWNYFVERVFENEDDFFGFAGNAMDRSVFYTEVDLQYGDELMTLSTCYYPFGGTTDRFVVFARRVRPGEDPTVDVSKAYINESPLYFDLWYRRRGGSWGGRNWDTSLVKGFDEWYVNTSQDRINDIFRGQYYATNR
jgi:sortase B